MSDNGSQGYRDNNPKNYEYEFPIPSEDPKPTKLGVDYKYGEGEVLQELHAYIDSTYGQHYVKKDLQVLDIYESLGNASTTYRDNAIKYLCRFGEKNGKNRKDLMKVLHYVILMLGLEENQDGSNPK